MESRPVERCMPQGTWEDPTTGSLSLEECLPRISVPLLLSLYQTLEHVVTLSLFCLRTTMLAKGEPCSALADWFDQSGSLHLARWGWFRARSRRGGIRR